MLHAEIVIGKDLTAILKKNDARIKAAVNTVTDLHQSPLILLDVIPDLPRCPHSATKKLKISPERLILSAAAIPPRRECT